MGKKKCASGGMIHSPKSMQEQLADIRPRFADGGKVDPVEELLKRSAAKYGTAVLPPAPQPPVAQPATTAQQPERGLLSLPGKIQQRTDELQRVMDYDKPKPRGMASGGIPGIDEPVSLAGPAPFRQEIGAGSGATALQSGNLSGLPAAAGMTPQSQGFLGAPDYSTGPKNTGFVSGDGTPRGVDQGQSPSTSREYAPGLSASRGISDTIAMNKAMAGLSMVDRAALSNPTNQPYMADGRLAQTGRTFVTPGSAAESSMLNAQTSALESLQKNLMAPLKLGSSANPNASGGFAATALQRAALPDATQAQPVPAMPANPMDSPSRRSRGRQQFSDGGMVKFSGKGGPREDKIPVKVAGENIRVSNGESAVILPAKTAANPQAVQAIGQVIQNSNDGRTPDMGGVQSGGKYELGTVRIVPSDAELMRGLQETEIARAADAQARQVAQRVFPTLPGQVELRDKAIQANNPQSAGAYKAELATRDAMTARAAESANMQAAIDGAKSQPAINPKAVPARPIYQPNWTAGNNSPVLEGVVETADEVRAKSATPPRQAIGAPQPGTAVTPRAVDWTPGGNPPAGGPVQARSVDWTYGQNSGPAQQPGMAAQAARQVQQIAAPQAVPTPQPVAQPPQSAAYRAGHAYAKAGGATGLASKALNFVAPAMAAAETLGDNGIKVAGLRESDPGYNESSGIPRAVGTAKELALRAGDWGTKGLDILGGWALPAKEESFNNLYRQRVGLLDGVTAPTTADVANQQRIDAANSAPRATFSNEGGPSAVRQAGMAAQAIAATPDPRIAANTGNAGNAKFNPDTGTLSFMKPGFDVTEQQVAPGTGMVSRANGKIQVIANMSPNQYTAADGTPNARWEQTQQYIDAQARLQADKARVAEVEATQQGMNPVQAIAATQGMAQAAQRAPLDRAVVQQQIETGKVAAQNAQRLQAAADAVTNAKTPEEQAAALRTYHGITGKNDMPPIPVRQGSTKTTDAAGVTTNTEPPDRLWNPNTRQWEGDSTAFPAVQVKKTPNKSAVDHLKANPGTAKEFDQWYGEGSAKQVLGK